MTTRTRVMACMFALAIGTVGLEAQMRSNKLGLGVASSMYTYSGDYLTKASGLGGGLSVSYSPWQSIGFRALAGVGQFGYTVSAGSNPAGSGEALTTFMTLNLYVAGNLMPNSSFNPFVTAGAGYIYFDPRLKTGVALTGADIPTNDFNYFVGGGFDYFLSEFVSVSLGAEMCISNTDQFDGSKPKSSASNDSYLRAGLEVRYYFFDKAFLARMLETLKARYE